MNKHPWFGAFLLGVFLLATLAYVKLSLARSTQGLEPSAPVPVSFWHSMDGPRGAALENLVKEFNETHPRVRVEPKFVGSAKKYANHYNVLIREVLASLQAGSPPVMAQVYENWTSQLIATGSITPLQRFIDSPGGLSKEDLEDFLPLFLESNRYEKTLWTLPFNKSVYVLFYNRAAFQKARLRPPETWDDLDRVASKLTEKDSSGEVRASGLVFLPGVDIFGLLYYSRGGDYFRGEKAVFNDARGVKALEFLTSLVQRKAAIPSYDALQDFAAGKGAMYIETTSKIPFITKIARFPLGVAPLPRGDHDSFLFAGTNLAIFSGAPQEKQEAAWVFIKWLLSPKNCTRWAVQTGYLPVRRSSIESQEFQSFLREDPRLQAGIDSVRKAKADPRVWAWQTIRGLIDEAVEKAVSKKGSVKELLDAAVQKTDQLLSGEKG